jgi:hypothetical protein
MKNSHYPASIETDITCLWGNGAYLLDGSRHACDGCQLPSIFTGRHTMVDTAGRVEVFRKNMARRSPRPGERGICTTAPRPCRYRHAYMPLGARVVLGHRAVVKPSVRHDTASDSDEGSS